MTVNRICFFALCPQKQRGEKNPAATWEVFILATGHWYNACDECEKILRLLAEESERLGCMPPAVERFRRIVS